MKGETDIADVVREAIRHVAHTGLWPDEPDIDESFNRAFSALARIRQDLARKDAALRAVQTRRDRINGALGFEFVGEYIDRALSPKEEE